MNLVILNLSLLVLDLARGAMERAFDRGQRRLQRGGRRKDVHWIEVMRKRSRQAVREVRRQLIRRNQS